MFYTFATGCYNKYDSILSDGIERVAPYDYAGKPRGRPEPKMLVTIEFLIGKRFEPNPADPIT